MNTGIYPAVSRVKTKTAGPGGIFRRCRDRPLNSEAPECLGILRGHAAENLSPQPLAPERPADREVREIRPVRVSRHFRGVGKPRKLLIKEPEIKPGTGGIGRREAKELLNRELLTGWERLLHAEVCCRDV